MELHSLDIDCIPQQVIRNALEVLRPKRHRLLPERDDGNKVVSIKDLVHDLPDMVEVLIADLHENTACR